MQRWKSNPMFWCEYCKVWLQDNPSAKATHERGMKHTDAVAKSEAPALQMLFHRFRVEQQGLLQCQGAVDRRVH